MSCIGAGSFARAVIFPALRKNRAVALHSVATASGIASESARRLFGFTRAVAPADLLQDKDTDAVFILSRHDSHAQYVVAALSSHKPVLVEKPLAVNREQLEEIRSVYRARRKRTRPLFSWSDTTGVSRRLPKGSENSSRVVRSPWW